MIEDHDVPDRITPEWITGMVREVFALSNDSEAAHAMEDELYEHVLLAIASDACDDPKACAKEAIKTKQIRFSRWCA